MASEMVERVARAICASVGKDPDAPFRDRHGRLLDFPEWERWQGEARAAIATMREPTSDMLSAMEPWARTSGHQDMVWKVGIDTALK